MYILSFTSQVILTNLNWEIYPFSRWSRRKTSLQLLPFLKSLFISIFPVCPAEALQTLSRQCARPVQSCCYTQQVHAEYKDSVWQRQKQIRNQDKSKSGKTTTKKEFTTYGLLSFVLTRNNVWTALLRYLWHIFYSIESRNCFVRIVIWGQCLK